MLSRLSMYTHAWGCDARKKRPSVDCNVAASVLRCYVRSANGDSLAASVRNARHVVSYLFDARLETLLHFPSHVYFRFMVGVIRHGIVVLKGE